MKRILCLLIALCIAAELTGCAKQDAAFEKPVSFYYLCVNTDVTAQEIPHGSDTSIIAPEAREGAGFEGLEELLALYFRGPQDQALYSPFPRGTAVTQITLDRGTVKLTLTKSFSSLTGIDLTLACACIIRTAAALDESVTAVEIRAEDAHLDGKEVIVMKSSDYFLTDNAAIPQQ